MLNELAAFGSRIRPADSCDALKQEMVSVDIRIDEQGAFLGFVCPADKIPTQAEALQSKKGKARLLLDKAEEVLGLEEKKHALFLEKMDRYRHVASLGPVLRFYGENKSRGLDKAVAALADQVPEKKRKENFAFLLAGESMRIHEKEDVRQAIIEAFAASQAGAKKKEGRMCSVCGSAEHPIVAQPHGMIKGVPAGQSTGCALISYNEKAFESYGLAGNQNSSVCTACARNYVEGLNHLMNNGELCKPEKGKPYKRYSNRKNLASDTAMIFWTRRNAPFPELDYVDNTEENLTSIQALIMAAPASAKAPGADELLLLLNAPFTGNRESLSSVDAEQFYSCTLSGSAARIAVRNWIESTTPEVRRNLAAWFHDIAMTERDFAEKTAVLRFSPLRVLSGACGVHRKREQGGKTVYSPESGDDFPGRAAAMLWNCALLGTPPPRTLLDRVLRRIRMEEGRVTAPRAALLKLILNRNTQASHQGEQRMQPQLDEKNTSVAYTAGRIFAMLESIQTAALGRELNAPIRERFYSAASTSPAATFGRLLKLSQAHLSKLRGEKYGLFVTLDKKLGELFTHISDFPSIFSLEEQGRFAIGYYHQRQDNFTQSAGAETGTAGE